MTEFYKYHGTGNDFIIIDNRNYTFDTKDSEKIRSFCDRHFGIGADGIIFLENKDGADCFMNYYNSDGTIAEMCGNGIRCLAKFFLEKTSSNLKEISIDTRAGIKKIICNGDGSFSVDMGLPIFSHTDFPNNFLELENYLFNFVSMGNPHAVAQINNLEEINIKTLGPKIENNKIFPNKINVEFIEKINDTHFKVKVWERGCGETLSCGTGACAIFAILTSNPPARQNLAETKEITLEFPGGKLFLSKNEKDHVILRGPATFVFKGEIN
ncbi:MAG: diaminopimelate epimerase [Burkholderiales bacterium]|nr:diaminopimelate epimerase [Burkholderiales bacterium]